VRVADRHRRGDRRSTFARGASALTCLFVIAPLIVALLS
jgi:hypothetical protein